MKNNLLIIKKYKLINLLITAFVFLIANMMQYSCSNNNNVPIEQFIIL